MKEEGTAPLMHALCLSLLRSNVSIPAREAERLNLANKRALFLFIFKNI